jgi:hypothetical protein
MTMHLEELSGSIFPSYLKKHMCTTGMGVREGGQVVDLRVYYNKERVDGVVTCDLIAGEGCGSSCDHILRFSLFVEFVEQQMKGEGEEGGEENIYVY